MIQRQIIDGRKCSVQYLNDQHMPVENKDDHTMLRVLWDDGTSATLVLQTKENTNDRAT